MKYNEKKVLLADDIVTAVFCKLRDKENIGTITSKRSQLHEIFYEFSLKYPKIFGDLKFRNKDGFMESASLDQALKNLEDSNLIRKYNNGKKFYYTITPTIKTVYLTYISHTFKDLSIPEQSIDDIVKKNADLFKIE